MLEEIQEWVGDKSILVVGNGPKVDESDGEVVVRMNLGIEKPCDIWVDNVSHLHLGKKIHHTPACKFIVHTTKYWHYDKVGEWSLPKIWNVGKDLHLDRPSTGMMTLWWLLKFFPDNRKIITGYNGKINRYTNKKEAGPHDFKKERDLLKGWHDKGKLEWLDESDYH